ncbi:MAG: acyltransferase [Roseburia sp.]
MESFYSQKELEKIGFKELGEDVKISRHTCIYGAETISIGNHVRIDDFCRMSGKIKIGDYVHISVYDALFGGSEGIVIEDFANLSSRVSVYAQSDDYSGEELTNSTIPNEYKKIISKVVRIERHAIIGASSVILPGVTVAEGTACGAMSLINKSTEPWSLCVGIPAKKIKDRKKELLVKEKMFLDRVKDNNCK